jgi:N-methylhydantoinase B
LEKSTVNVMLERLLEPPWGINGGGEGRSNHATLVNMGSPERAVTKESNIALNQGDTIVFQTAGGGGYGDPKRRSPEKIKEDLEQEYISLESAKVLYGYTN